MGQGPSCDDEMVFVHGGLFLHVFLSGEPEGEVCPQPSMLGGEGLVEDCDRFLLTYEEGCSDLGSDY